MAEPDTSISFGGEFDSDEPPGVTVLAASGDPFPHRLPEQHARELLGGCLFGHGLSSYLTADSLSTYLTTSGRLAFDLCGNDCY